MILQRITCRAVGRMLVDTHKAAAEIITGNPT